MPGLRLKPRRFTADSTAALASRADAELLALAGAGRAEAFEVVYDRHCGVAFSLAYRICGERGAAEDAVQEAFLALWRSGDRYDPVKGQVRSWLLQVVRNSAIDRMRRSGVHERRRADVEEIEERVQAPGRTDEEVVEREQAAAVRRALDALPTEQRRVIELAYFDGMTHSQIAAKLEPPVGTIKGRMRLGLLKLHAQLSQATAGAREAT